MTEPKRRDKVRVTFEAEYVKEDSYFHRLYAEGGTVSVPTYATVEVIEPADDPSKDPVGTVRSDGYSTAVKTGNYYVRHERYEDRNKNGWVLLGNGAHEYATRKDEHVIGWEIIGAVPGTPAAEAQKARELWTGDGSEEPPAHVKKVRDKDGYPLTRQGPVSWVGNDDPEGWTAIAHDWSVRSEFGPFTEVPAE